MVGESGAIVVLQEAKLTGCEKDLRENDSGGEDLMGNFFDNRSPGHKISQNAAEIRASLGRVKGQGELRCNAHMRSAF
jgi:hypothetical protein